MKNLHYLKKFVVMVLAAMMTLSTFALPTFAKNGPVTITGLEKDVQVTFYKIADVNASGSIERIDAVPDTVIKNLEEPTSKEIIDLAANPAGLTAADTQVATGDSVTSADLAPGIYMATFSVKAGGNPDYIYNPVIVSVDKNGAGDAATIDAGTKYKWGDKAQAKKSTVTFDKVVERDLNRIEGDDKGANAENGSTTGDEANKDADGDGKADGNRGDTAAAGETVSFRINTQIPAYADNFFTEATGGPAGSTVKNDPGYEIYDTFDGLTLVSGSVVVYQGATKLTEGTDYDLTEKDNGYEIKFTGTGVWDNRGKAIEVRYSATVNDNAERVNFNGDTNNAKNKYTRAPGAAPTDADERTTYHYKFTINGNIDGNGSRENREVITVGTDVFNKPILVEEVTGITEEGWKPLNKVKFYLYDNEAAAKANKGGDTACREVESDADGILRGMNQLDAGNYWLVEAPQDEQTAEYQAKYNVNESPIEVKITAKHLADGRLASYMIEVAGEVVGNYVKDYNVGDKGSDKGTESVQKDGSWKEVNGEEVGVGDKIADIHKVQVNGKNVPNDKDDYGVAVDIVNSKVGTLPSTGGMGTVLFTIGGVVIMGLALLLLFGGKKKQQQK